MNGGVAVLIILAFFAGPLVYFLGLVTGVSMTRPRPNHNTDDE